MGRICQMSCTRRDAERANNRIDREHSGTSEGQHRLLSRRMRGLLLVIIIFVSSVVAVAAVQLLARYALSGPSYRSAILDELSTDHPDPQLISSLVRIMEDTGFSVDVYSPSKVTVDLYRVLAMKRYQFVLFRVHSAFQDGDTWLFTSEAYSKETLLNRYNVELLSDQIAPARSFLGQEMVLAVGPEFIRRGSLGNWMDAVIVLAGCYGTAGESLPQAFVERGVSVVIGWDGLVSANHADRASLTLVKLLFEEKMAVRAAVDETMLQVGQDMDFGSLLTFYPADRSPDRSLWMSISSIVRGESETVWMSCEAAPNHSHLVSVRVRQDADAIFE